MDTEDIQRAIEDCESARSASNCPFSKWEMDFIDSITEQFEERGSLSERQQEKLQAIWDKI